MPLPVRTVLFLACYCVFVTAANVFLKLSADAHGVWLFLAFQAEATWPASRESSGIRGCFGTCRSTSLSP